MRNKKPSENCYENWGSGRTKQSETDNGISQCSLLKKFEDHRDSKNGYFTPSGEFKSTLGWAHLLYALDIRPGRDIVVWNSPTGNVNPVDTVVMHLEMPAEGLWHIINLYRQYSQSDPRDSKDRDESSPRYRLPFGTVTLIEDNNMVVAEFKSTMPTTGGGNAITNFPFRCSQYSPLGPKLLFPQNQVITDYYMAFSISVSCS